MSKQYLLLVVFIVLLVAGCSNEALRSEEKFSRVKKYAILPFNCADTELSSNLVKELKERLIGDDYQIIETEKLDELLKKEKLTPKEVAENYMLVVGRVTDIDGIIIGNIGLDKKVNSRTSSGGNISYISSCDVMVVDVRSGEVLAKGLYSTPSTVLTSGSQRVNEVARNLSLQLSPH
jgi:hypothetical protein